MTKSSSVKINSKADISDVLDPTDAVYHKYIQPIISDVYSRTNGSPISTIVPQSSEGAVVGVT